MFVSKDQHSTYAVLTLAGADPEERLATFHKIADQVRTAPAGLDAKVGGEVAVFDEVNTQTEHDIVRAETISTADRAGAAGGRLRWSGRGVSLPLFVGALAILGAFVLLRGLSAVTDVSIFSINIVTMIGLGLAIDYALFIVTRFREELAKGNDVETALTATMATAGRTVAFSGVTVGVAISSLVLFPVMFLRSMAYGGAAAVAGRHDRGADRAARTARRTGASGEQPADLQAPAGPGRRARGLVPARAQRDEAAGAVRAWCWSRCCWCSGFPSCRRSWAEWTIGRCRPARPRGR